jgi:peptide/nickel transport system substrate-binding protein
MSLKKKTTAVVGAIAIASSMVMAGSAASAAQTNNWNGPVAPIPGAVRGGTVTLLEQGDFEHLDPARNYVGGALDFYRLMVRTLVSFRTVNGKSDIAPDLASDLGTTKDAGKTWTFKLRQGLKYEDGSTIKCEDIKYGTMRAFAADVLDGGPSYPIDFISSPEGYKGPYAEPDKDLSGVVCSPKGDSITYKLQTPVPYFPYIVTFGAFSPVPKAKDTKQNYDLRPFSAGPYKVESYQRGKRLTLVRNKYWDPKTDPIRWNYPDKFVVKMGSDQNIVENMIISDSGEAQTSVAADTNITTNLSKVLDNPKYKSRLFNYASTYSRYYAINVDTVKDVNVRKAIQCAFDYKSILLAAGGTTAGVYSNSTIPFAIKDAYRPFNICGRDVIKHPEAQIDAAKAFLAKATDKKTTLKLAFRDKGLEPLRAAALQQSLQAAGFTVVMQKMPKAGYYTAIGKRGVPEEADIIQTSWSPDWMAASGVVYALYDGRIMTPEDAKFNLQRDNFPDVQAMFLKSEKVSGKAQEKILGDIEQNLIVDKASVMPVYFETSHNMAGSKIGGLQVDGGYADLSVLGAYVKK